MERGFEGPNGVSVAIFFTVEAVLEVPDEDFWVFFLCGMRFRGSRLSFRLFL